MLLKSSRICFVLLSSCSHDLIVNSLNSVITFKPRAFLHIKLDKSVNRLLVLLAVIIQERDMQDLDMQLGWQKENK